jgi:hypothetical protein
VHVIDARRTLIDASRSLRNTPPFSCATVVVPTERAIVSLVLIRTDSGAIDSQGDVEITMVKRNSTVLHRDANGPSKNDVTFEIDDTQFAAGWERYLNGADGYDWSASRSGDSITADCEDTDRVVVRVTVIDVTFDTP